MAEVHTAALAAKQAAQRLGCSERMFYILRQRPDFPRGRRLGPKCVRWLICELDAWLAAQPEADLPDEPPQLERGRVYRSGRLVQPAESSNG